MGTTAWPVCTIGHSNHSAEEFVEMLGASGVDLVVDVRSVTPKPLGSALQPGQPGAYP